MTRLDKGCLPSPRNAGPARVRNCGARLKRGLNEHLVQQRRIIAAEKIGAKRSPT
jgi:hypothetical protein